MVRKPLLLNNFLQNRLAHFIFKLRGIQAVVIALLVEELMVGAVFQYFAIADDQNTVGRADGGQAVGNNKTGAAN